MKHTLIISALAGVLSLSTGYALAADQDRLQDRDQDRLHTQDTIYGSQLMTQQERAEYRTKLNGAKSAGQREQIRNEHHQRMQERAKSRGLRLPDSPPMQRHMRPDDDDMSPGNSMGPGSMGSGGGMGGMGGGR